MFQPKFVKFVVLPILLLILFVSPRLAAGAWLEPEDNIAIKCDFFIESVTIYNRPGEVRVSSIVHNISAEDSTRQLKLTIASFSENHNEINLIVQDLSYENGMLVEYIKTNPSKFDDLQLYRHEFRLIFDPPLSEGKRTITILYNTNGSIWENDLINMHLYVYIWSPKIVLQENAYVYVDGEGEGFKFKRVGEPWENWTYYNNNRGLRVVINPAALISNPYVRYIDALYTPGYPSQWYVWDQYQKIENTLQRTNQLMEETKNQLFYTRIALGATMIALFFAVFGFLRSRKGVRVAKNKKKGDKVSSLPKMKTQMSLGDRKNLELMYRDVVFLALAFLTAAITCMTMAVVINTQVSTSLGTVGSGALILMGIILFLYVNFFLFEKMKRIRKILGMHKTAEKYGLVK